MKIHLIFLVFCALITACSNSLYHNDNLKNSALTTENFSKNEILISDPITTPSAIEVKYYSSPDSTIAQLGVIPPDTKVRTLSRNGPWYKITYVYNAPVFVLISAIKYRTRSTYLRKPFDITNPSNPSYNGQNIQTGPRGGRYYINKNGNKTYVK